MKKFCDDNNIKYFLSYGTLLGAVRHKGYIPWDDDIDIAMLRDDYEKFVNNYIDKSGNYRVYYSGNCKKYYLPFAKVIDENTIVTYRMKFIKKLIGLNIDVFPIDLIPDNKDKQNSLFKRLSLLRKFMDLKGIIIIKGRLWHKNAIALFINIITFPISKKFLMKKMELLSQRYKGDLSASKAAICVWGYGKKEITDKSVFDKTILISFEGKEYTIPEKYDVWLSNIYGDYMKLPPKEKRISHGITAYKK